MKVLATTRLFRFEQSRMVWYKDGPLALLLMLLGFGVNGQLDPRETVWFVTASNMSFMVYADEINLLSKSKIS
jgi:hypothetical protein